MLHSPRHRHDDKKEEPPKSPSRSSKLGHDETPHTPSHHHGHKYQKHRPDHLSAKEEKEKEEEHVDKTPENRFHHHRSSRKVESHRKSLSSSAFEEQFSSSKRDLQPDILEPMTPSVNRKILEEGTGTDDEAFSPSPPYEPNMPTSSSYQKEEWMVVTPSKAFRKTKRMSSSPSAAD